MIRVQGRSCRFIIHPLLNIILAIIFAACLAPRYDGNVHAQTDIPPIESNVAIHQSDNATAEPDSPERVSDAPVPESSGGHEETTPDEEQTDETGDESYDQQAEPEEETAALPDTVPPEKEPRDDEEAADRTEICSVLAAPDKEAQVTSADNAVTLRIPAGAVDSSTNIEMKQHTQPAGASRGMLRWLEFNARLSDSDAKVSRFNQPLEITITHTLEEIQGLDPDSIRLYYLDEESSSWQPVESSRFDKERLVLTAAIDHFSDYSEYGASIESGPGRVLAAQVNAHSGAATFSYPIELPPGRGGFTPELVLTYNSAVVDEMKDKRDTASWVGMGWSLHLGRISHTSDNQYYLELNGMSYKLITNNGINYSTIPDEHFKIVHDEIWEVWDREGNYYKFAAAWHYNTGYGPFIYRYDLTQMRDTNGNTAWVNYVRDLYDNSVRSAYPEYLKYNGGKTVVHFISSYDNEELWSENGEDIGSGRTRIDNPLGTEYNPIPIVMENRKLEAIEISANGTLVNKYTFTYNTTNSVYSGHYNGIYYAGQHRLMSITQLGADGSSSLPALTFSHQSLPITYEDTYMPAYSGNPGNPASISRSRLKKINSGYGGHISFAYTQAPAAPAANIWSRQIVASMTADAGTEPDIVTAYAYAGGPAYYGDNWHAEYRGFNEVQETDSTGNYNKRYFFTTGTIEDSDADKLTGKEYRRQWYDSQDTLLKQEDYSWGWSLTEEITQCPYSREYSYWTGPTPPPQCLTSSKDVDISNNGYIFVVDHAGGEANRIVVFPPSGSYAISFNSWPHGVSTRHLMDPKAISISESGYIHVIDGNRIVVFDANNDYSYVTLFDSWVQGNFTRYFTDPLDLVISDSGYLYVVDNNGSAKRVLVFDATNNYSYVTTIDSWTEGNFTRYFVNPTDVDIADNGYLYVVDSNGSDTKRIVIFDTTDNNSYVTQLNSWMEGLITRYFSNPVGVDVSTDNNIYVVEDNTSTDRVIIFDGNNDYKYVTQFNSWQHIGMYATCFCNPSSIAISDSGCIYVLDNPSPHPIRYRVIKFEAVNHNWAVTLDEASETVGDKTSRTRYIYDDCGNIVTEYRDGDLSTNDDDATIHRRFNKNLDLNILTTVGRERVYAAVQELDDGGSNMRAHSQYYYDGNDSSLWAVPTKGNVTRVWQRKNETSSRSRYYTYDSYGNVLSVQDARGTTAWTYDTTYRAYPVTKSYPVPGLSESYTYDPGTSNLLSMTDVNGQTTSYEYDTFKRLIKVIKPGDSSGSPGIERQYNNWGTLYQQHIKSLTKVDEGRYLWESVYFDGLGRIIQAHACGEAGRMVISSTTGYTACGLTDKEYVSQDLDSAQVSGYKAPEAGWKYSSYTYDGLDRITSVASADGTTVSHDYTTPWQELVTDANGHKKRYRYDTLYRLIKVEELDEQQQIYATTTYSYDILDNLAQVVDDDGNITSISYDMLSRKTGMVDPDMGCWSYTYDGNDNLIAQTDAKMQTIAFSYDAMNRLTGKIYPSGSDMTDVVYTYDSTADGNCGKGRCTGMTDAAGSINYKYDSRGRVIEETRTVDSIDYMTQYAYDGADRKTSITYPTGEVVAQGYNGRGLPYSLSGTVSDNITESVYYNNLGLATEINAGNGTKTTFGYWDTGGAYDITGGYYGRLWRIHTTGQPGGSADFQDIRHSWDASGNLTQRQDALADETETFSYDFLDRLTGVSGPYAESYTYNEIGNITGKNGAAYSYEADAVTFAWDPVPGAANYHLTVIKTSDSSVKFDADIGNVTSYCDTDYPDDGSEYYWTIKAGNAAGWSGTSQQHIFTSGRAAAAPLPPVLISPSNDVLIPGSEITFSWSASDNSTDYRLLVRYDATGAVFHESTVADTQKTVANFPVDGTVFNWCVCACNSAAWSPVSRIRTFTSTSSPPPAPVLFSPEGSSIVTGDSVTYQWGRSEGANKYWIRINNISDGTIKFRGDLGDTMQYTDSGYPDDGTVYEWMVWAGNELGWGPVSSIMSFTSGGVSQHSLDLQVAAGSDDCRRCRGEGDTFSLTAAENRSGAGGVNYHKYGSGLRFTNVAVPANADITAAYLTFTALIDRPYRWYSYISAELVTDAPAFTADKAAFDARFNGTKTARVDYSNNIAWVAENEYTSSDISGVIEEIVAQTGWESGNSIVLFWEDFDDRSADTCYRSAYSYNSDPAKAPELHIEYTVPLGPLPGIPALTTPDNAAFAPGTSLAFAWTIPDGAEGYELQAAYDADFSTLLLDVYAGANDYTSLEVFPDDGTRFYWRMRASNESGDGSWSEVRTFLNCSSDLLPPAAPEPVSPLNGELIYSDKPHAVSSVGETNYGYDANGNMTVRGSQSIVWDVENRPVSITSDNNTSSFVYDGWGGRVKKTEGGQTTLYINKYYEKNLTTGVETSHYYLGENQVALREGGEVRYLHLDHLTGTSLMSDSSGGLLSSIKYFPYGATRAGGVATDKLFTGQRLDGTGLYYYNARYYDAGLGRFISADTFVQQANGRDVVSRSLTVNAIPAGMGKVLALQMNYPGITLEVASNPQAYNRYTYVFNNPLRYNDPYGWWTEGRGWTFNVGFGLGLSISRIVVIDGYGNKAIAWSFYGGGYLPTSSFCYTYQETSADNISQLAGWFGLVGGSFGTRGTAFGGDYFGSNENGYDGYNIDIGVGTPGVEIHGTFGYTWLTHEENPNSIMDYSFKDSIDVGGGFSCWGFTDQGAPVVSMNDPSTYSDADWYY